MVFAREELRQGVKKRCRLSWLTNSALVYEPKCGGGGGCGVSANEYSCAHGAQINFGDLTHYLTYELRSDPPVQYLNNRIHGRSFKSTTGQDEQYFYKNSDKNITYTGYSIWGLWRGTITMYLYI